MQRRERRRGRNSADSLAVLGQAQHSSPVTRDWGRHVAAKLPLKPTDKNCQQRRERNSFWPTPMPGLITSNYREVEQSKGRDGAALKCVGCGTWVS